MEKTEKTTPLKNTKALNSHIGCMNNNTHISLSMQVRKKNILHVLFPKSLQEEIDL